MAQICRTCLQNIEDNNGLHLTEDGIKHQLAVCLPELLPNLVSEPVICRLCLMTLRLAYDFICKCLVNERRVGSFYKRNWRPFSLAEMIRYHSMGGGTATVDDVERRLSFMEIQGRANSMEHCARRKCNKGQQFSQFPLRECVVVLTRISEADIIALSGRAIKNIRQNKVSNYTRKSVTRRKANPQKRTLKNKIQKLSKLKGKRRGPKKSK